MTGVLLIEMGGANSPKELKLFLSRMFKDPFILPFGKLGRTVFSFIISNTRYKKSWKKYELIGGSPIIDSTNKMMQALQHKLGDSYKVKMAFSYSSPLIENSLTSFLEEGIEDVTVIPLYPQASYTTTYSAKYTVNSFAKRNKIIKIDFVQEFYKHKDFISFWSNLIFNHIKDHNLSNPFLIFSAHSIPLKLIETGDKYAEAIQGSASLIAEAIHLDYKVSYQSKMKGKWVGPDTKDCLKILSSDIRDRDIVLIPISFVNENLETLYDLDLDIIPFARNEQHIKSVSRVRIPVADNRFINLLKEIVESK
ncbi:MAG: ferrochelatase [Bacteroidota bacterium]